MVEIWIVLISVKEINYFSRFFVEGALLHLGDVHVMQGDGDLGGPPVEIASECTLTIDLIKNKAINWPRIESPEYIMTVGNSKPLEDACRIATTEMLYWLRDEYSFDLWDAVCLSSNIFRARINQVKRTFVECRYDIKRILKKNLLLLPYPSLIKQWLDIFYVYC